MQALLAECIGTALLILLGNGVVAGVVLRDTKNHNAGWLVITFGWALAVTFAVYAVGGISGAHLNPAVSLALAATGQWSEKFTEATLPIYLAGQMLGATLGAVLVYWHYLPHWERTENADDKLAVFCTAPAVRHTTANFISEFLGTFVLLFGLCALGANQFAAGLNPMVVGALVLSIGLSLGGTTGYAINPARDLGPRLAHALLPIPGKRDADWSYAWIPVVAPIAGGITGAVVYRMLFL
jgi:glycerol uptake facilitator protein